MHIVIAPDSFKGNLTSIEVGEIITKGLKRAIPDVKTTVFPMADGGEGTMDSFLYHLNGEKQSVIVKDPLLREHETYITIIQEKGKKTAIIESASTIGLPLLSETDKSPLTASSKGLGEAIKKGLGLGIRNFIIGLGGSATNDGGLGMLEALGTNFFDKNGKRLQDVQIKDIFSVKKADLSSLDSRILESSIVIASDVDNPLCGPRGASAVFGPQKGATVEMISQLDACLNYFSTLFPKGEQLKEDPGAGAAGGLGFAMLLLNGKLQSGSKIIADALEIEKAIKGCDIVLTGEGKTDEQTLYGKAPFYIAKMAKEYEKPVIILSGSLGNGYESLNSYADAFFSIMKRPASIEEAMENGKDWLEATSYHVGCLLNINLKLKGE